jgi:hypothetical protein
MSGTTSVTGKVCADCGKDVREVRRVRDSTGRYFCQTCWDARPHPGPQLEALLPDGGRADVDGDEQGPADLAAQRRESRTIAVIVTVGVIVGISIIGPLVYVMFVRDWLDQRRGEHLSQARAQAEALVTAAHLDAANTAFAETLRQFGVEPFRNAESNRSVQIVRAEAQAVTAAIEARDAAQAKADADYRDRLADYKSRVGLASQVMKDLPRIDEEGRVAIAEAEGAFQDDPVVEALSDRYPDMKVLFERRNRTDRERITAKLQMMVGGGLVQLSDAKHVFALFENVDKARADAAPVSTALAQQRAVLDEPALIRAVVTDADFCPNFGPDGATVGIGRNAVTTVNPGSANLSRSPVEAQSSDPVVVAPAPTATPSTPTVTAASAVPDAAVAESQGRPFIPPAVSPTAGPPSDPRLPPGRPRDAAAGARLSGDWKGKGLLMQVRQASDGTLSMSQPNKGYVSTGSRLVGTAAVFHWSNLDEVLVLRVTSDRTADLDCYPSDDGNAIDAGQQPSKPAKWHRRMQKVSGDR